MCFSTQGITYAASTTTPTTYTQTVSYAKKTTNKNIVTGKMDNKKQSWTYNKKTHTLTINGTGNLDVLYYKIPKGSDLDEGEAEISTPWSDYTKDITSVVIGDGITSVSATRFDELPNLKKITLGKGIKKVTRLIFAETKVREVVIPDTVTTISKKAFEDCKQITSISLGAGVTSIAEDAFDCSKQLQTISLSPKNKSFSFENGMLMDKAHTTVYLALGDENHTVTIPSTVTFINPPGLERLETEQIVVDPNNSCYASIDGILYSKDLKTLYVIPTSYRNNSIVLPTELEKKYDVCVSHIFDQNTSNVSKIVFGEKTDARIFMDFNRWNRDKKNPIYLDVSKNENFSVADGAVYDKEMTTLYVYQGTGQEYVMPDTVKELDEWSTIFPTSCNLTSITLGANVSLHSGWTNKKLDLNIPSMQRIEVSTQSAIYSSKDGILYNKEGTTCILCPKGYGKTITIPEGTKAIEYNAFYEMSAESITLPSTLKTIDNNAFEAVSNLKTIEIPIHTRAKRYAFENCPDLETILWNSTVAAYNPTFYNCPNLTNLIIGPDANNLLRNKLLMRMPDKYFYVYSFTNVTLDKKNPNYTIKNDFLLDKKGKTVYARSSSLSKLKKVLKKCKITDKRYISRFKKISN